LRQPLFVACPAIGGFWLLLLHLAPVPPALLSDCLPFGWQKGMKSLRDIRLLHAKNIRQLHSPVNGKRKRDPKGRTINFQ